MDPADHRATTLSVLTTSGTATCLETGDDSPAPCGIRLASASTHVTSGLAGGVWISGWPGLCATSQAGRRDGNFLTPGPLGTKCADVDHVFPRCCRDRRWWRRCLSASPPGPQRPHRHRLPGVAGEPRPARGRRDGPGRVPGRPHRDHPRPPGKPSKYWRPSRHQRHDSAGAHVATSSSAP